MPRTRLPSSVCPSVRLRRAIPEPFHTLTPGGSFFALPDISIAYTIEAPYRGGTRKTMDKIRKSDEEWRRSLTPEQYRILREKGTERPFTGQYAETKTPGVYLCAACGLELFASDTKFDSGCGWPSFYDPLDKACRASTRTAATAWRRTEVTCARCGGHLGHVFPDGPNPTGLRYCINSASLRLDKVNDKTNGKVNDKLSEKVHDEQK